MSENPIGFESDAHPVLAIEDLTVSFDGFKAVDGLNLYVQRNVPVTLSNWLCRPYKATSQETCTLTSPTAARYYIRVHAFGKFAGVRLSAGY